MIKIIHRVYLWCLILALGAFAVCFPFDDSLAMGFLGIAVGLVIEKYKLLFLFWVFRKLEGNDHWSVRLVRRMQ